MSRERLTNYEQETIINFNKAEDTAHIFTYEKTWQKHLEKKLGLKPEYDNGFGGRDYLIPKKRIPMPRVPRKLSKEAKENLSARLSKARQRKSILSENPHNAVRKSTTEKGNWGNSRWNSFCWGKKE